MKVKSSNIRQVFQYIMATGLSACITLGVPAVLHERLGVMEEAAVAVGLGAAFIVNFLVIRLVIFRSAGSPAGDLMRFILVSVLFRLGEYLGFLLLNNVLDIFYMVSLGVVLSLSLVLKFLSYRFYVFKPIPSAPVPAEFTIPRHKVEP